MGTESKLAAKIVEANRALETVSIREKSGRLYLRGSKFPPRPGEVKSKREELPLGVSASSSGLTVALRRAKLIDAQVLNNTFDWTPFLKEKEKPPEKTGDWVARFEEEHWQRNKRTPSKENHFYKNYRILQLRLPQDEPLTLDLLTTTLQLETKPESRTRQIMSIALRKLGEFAGIEGVEILKELGKGYTSKSIDPRTLPTDEQIAEARAKIGPDPGWLWTFDVIALYGLRPHEIFHLNTHRLGERIPVLEVRDETKTGFRVAYPIRAEEWSAFDVQYCVLPPIEVRGDRSNNALGNSISQKFRQRKLGFTPYDLRHAFCRRGVEKGFNESFLAKTMGHSIAVQRETYRAWFTQSTYDELYLKAMGELEK